MKLYFEKEIANQVCETSLPVHKLNNKKILVTGCNGFIPSAFIKILNQIMDMHGYKIQFYGIARKTSNNRSNILQSLIKTKKLKIFKLNLNKEININIFPDICIHGASITSPNNYTLRPVETLMTNTLGTINLLNFCSKKKVKKFIFLSSSEVYGDFRRANFKKKIFSEENYGLIDSSKIISNLALSKKFGENSLKAWTKEFNLFTNSIRLFHTYGPFMKLGDGRIHSDLVKDIVNNRNLLIKGNLKIKRAFCYISDALSGILTVILKGEKGEIYNLANPEEIHSVKKIAHIILRNRNNKLLKITTKKKKFGVRNDFIYPKPSVKKLSDLGWRPKVDAIFGFKRTIQFFIKKKNDHGIYT